MNNASIAPCGVICDICLGFQRKKNTCVGCNSDGNKPYHCTVCSIKSCEEKKGNEKLLCYECIKFPCRRIKSLDKRYIVKYGESPIQNLKKIKDIGIDSFISIEKEKWKCENCGYLLCVHKEVCLNCNAKNKFFP
ncbi:MAG: hypothetical protein CVU05_15665 [Bacteroidetes bacterium HGW-Bacteroidetes-21]|jgi:hypothetical protein|nr:MAG: hypothetical protein CVU05_15665 [Bacteroidetes bacterium HGW-Bacteroidetes-21]